MILLKGTIKSVFLLFYSMEGIIVGYKFKNQKQYNILMCFCDNDQDSHLIIVKGI